MDVLRIAIRLLSCGDAAPVVQDKVDSSLDANLRQDTVLHQVLESIVFRVEAEHSWVVIVALASLLTEQGLGSFLSDIGQVKTRDVLLDEQECLGKVLLNMLSELLVRHGNSIHVV